MMRGPLTGGPKNPYEYNTFSFGGDDAILQHNLGVVYTEQCQGLGRSEPAK